MWLSKKLLIAGLMLSVSLRASGRKETSTAFYFNGNTISQYFVSGGDGWVLYTTQPYSYVGNMPSIVSHSIISTPEELVEALAAASGSSIHERITNIGAVILNYKIL
ncbi:hypothetical protein MKQ70_32035 [Chitinophaga sedimenti]|uniref:hypothetical protein n=1 Tax=Chitinophaga sedimenti TaxID=2033606 RepID=UPI002004952E|nr:hypothetical protein [Chitinophaga sedimenti]MCK7559348.1 hypothetical protein [Chitinophaga sedimenti]